MLRMGQDLWGMWMRTFNDCTEVLDGMTGLQRWSKTFWSGVRNGANVGFNIWMEFYIFSEDLSIWAQESL